MVERAEAMLLDRVDFLVAQRRAGLAPQSERAEAAVALVAPGAAGDLRHFGDGQAAVAPSVELFETRKGHMGHVHVEPHADRVGGHQIIDFAALEHGDLGVAGGRRQSAHDHRCAALESAQHLGQRVDLLGGEGDHCASRRQAR